MRTITCWVTVLLLFWSVEATSQTLSQYYQQEKTLDNQVVQALRLSLDPVQPNLGGMNEKFLVRDQLGRRWLFKSHQSSHLDNVSVMASEVARYMNVSVPRAYMLSLTLNGKSRQGTLMEWIEEAVNMEDFLPNQLSNSQLDQLFKQQILDYILVNYDVRPDNFIYQEKVNQIWGIDKDFAFDYWDEDLPLTLNPGIELSYFEDYYVEAWKSYIETEKQVNWNELLELIAYVNQMDESFLSLMIEPVFKFKRVKKNVGDWNTFLKYKGEIQDAFYVFYKEIIQKKGLPVEFLVFPESNDYAQKVRVQAKERIELRKEELAQLKAAQKGEQQKFDLVMSLKAWRYVLDNEDKGPQVILKGLNRILSQTKEPNEREAVQLYIKQVQRWDPVNPRDWDMNYVIKFPKSN